MNSLEMRIKKKQESTSPRSWFKNEDGAIDLASIMVGIIVIGLIGGVIAATVFTVIPWTQDNAAKQQLDSVVSAESAYFGLSSDNPPALPAGSKANTFGNSVELAAAKLMSTGPNYCVVTPADGKSYTAYSKSASGAVFTVTDKNSKAQPFSGPVPDPLPADCQFLAGGVTGGGNTNTDIDGDGIPNDSDTDIDGDGIPNDTDPQPTTPTTTPPVVGYIDPTPTITKMTFKCDVNTTGIIPLTDGLTGTETWDDGVPARTYTNASSGTARDFIAGVTYTMTFDGTYKRMSVASNTTTAKLKPCLRSVDHWGSATGTTSARQGFYQAVNLTSVPEHIPSTLTQVEQMFRGASKFNDPNISKWDVTNFQVAPFMFDSATSFNQPLNDWNVSNLIETRYMFNNATAFNRPLDKWNVSKVADMRYMFLGATSFVQDLSGWKTDAITDVYYASVFANSSTFPANYLPPKATF